ncbi:quinol:cytochrome C oxidoreductase [bacterium]|nr:quinol:cytochrome C oxidoreductase [bacterium]
MLNASEISKDNLHLNRLAPPTRNLCGGVGLIVLLLTCAIAFMQEDGLRRFYHTYLVSFSFVLSLSLGALFFVLLQHLTHASWSVVVRRLAEVTAANIPVLAILFIPILIGMGELYHWTHPEAVAADKLLQVKKPFLNIPFFLVRCIIYFAIWWRLASYLLDRSTAQDESGDPQETCRMGKVSTYGMALFALSLTFFSFDALMSLEPHWYSTIFGVYFFAGSMVGFIALITIFTFLLQRAGRVQKCITIEHYHDYGKLLFGFIFFWAYIAFSQYMLIWYGNIPEETMWYLARQEGQWFWVSMILIFGHFAIPFLALLSRYPKRRKPILFGWAVWMLLMHYVDLYWLVMPHFSEDTVPLHIIDSGCLVGITGIWLYGIIIIAKKRALIPVKDPRLEASLTFENA